MPPFKVSLQCNRGGKGNFIGVGQVPILIRTEAHLTRPLIAPPSSYGRQIVRKKRVSSTLVTWTQKAYNNSTCSNVPQSVNMRLYKGPLHWHRSNESKHNNNKIDEKISHIMLENSEGQTTHDEQQRLHIQAKYNTEIQWFRS